MVQEPMAAVAMLVTLKCSNKVEVNKASFTPTTPVDPVDTPSKAKAASLVKANNWEPMLLPTMPETTFGKNKNTFHIEFYSYVFLDTKQ